MMTAPPRRSALAAFFVVNLLAVSIALGLSGSVVLVSWLVPDSADSVPGVAID